MGGRVLDAKGERMDGAEDAEDTEAVEDEVLPVGEVTEAAVAKFDAPCRVRDCVGQGCACKVSLPGSM